jgi:F0F1-type ATP synthase membrane subunit a
VHSSTTNRRKERKEVCVCVFVCMTLQEDNVEKGGAARVCGGSFVVLFFSLAVRGTIWELTSLIPLFPFLFLHNAPHAHAAPRVPRSDKGREGRTGREKTPFSLFLMLSVLSSVEGIQLKRFFCFALFCTHPPTHTHTHMQTLSFLFSSRRIGKHHCD